MLLTVLAQTTFAERAWTLANAGWVALLVGIVTAFIGGALSVWLYQKSKLTSELRYAVADAVVVGPRETGISKELEIRFAGEIQPRVVSTSVAIWNAGRTTISGDDVVEREPIELVTLDGSNILRVQFEATSRPANDARPGPPRTDGVEVRFNYLEPGDAIRLKVIHNGHRDALDVVGTVKGIPQGLVRYDGKGPFSIWLAPLFLLAGTGVAAAITQVGEYWGRIGGAPKWMLAVLIVPAAFGLVFAWREDRDPPSRKLRGVPDLVMEDEALLYKLKWPLRFRE